VSHNGFRGRKALVTSGILRLSICHSIVAAHEGRLWARNNPDRGASFVVSLPIHAEGHA